jgi:peptidoglycan/LPS O-acetylase OafA/YrhL
MTVELPVAEGLARSPARASPAAQPKHMPELDGVRGVAILAVLVLHFVGGLNAQNLAELVIVKLSVYGVWGVDLFFVLSGFLITGILHQARGAPRYFRNFYARRTLRIFPLYYAVLLALLLAPAAALAPWFPHLAQTKHVQGYLWAYLTNFYIGSTGSFSVPYVSHFWSLAVEEHFYLFWPFAIGALSLPAAKRACVLLGASALGLRMVLSWSSSEPIQAVVWTPCRLDALCCGAWFALALRTPGCRESVERLCKHLAYGALVAILLLSVWHARVGLGDGVVLALRGTALAICFGAFIVNLTSETSSDLVRRAFRARWLVTLGKYSYGLYVFHGIVAYSVHEHAWEHRWTEMFGSHALAAVLVTLAGFGLSFSIAFASFELFERPVLKLKRFFEYRAERGTTAAS